MRVLITGGAGFVGSNLGIKIRQHFAGSEVIAFDNLKRRGSELNLSRLKQHGIQFFHGDVRMKSDFEELPEVDFVIDASAEPSVLSGLNSSPDYLIDTNFQGTINCLNYAVKSSARMIFISTSRVYPIARLNEIQFTEAETRFEISSHPGVAGCTTEGITEAFPVQGPRSLYGATKLASELMIEEYREFLNVPSIINRCGVITGPYQMGKVDQGVVVLWLAKHYYNKSLAYFGFNGTGKQVRDILHIDDLFSLVADQLKHFDKYEGHTLNAGGGRNCSVSLKELTGICRDLTGNTIPIQEVKEERVADVRIYLTDNSFATSLNNWSPKHTPESVMEDIYRWLHDNNKQLEPILS
ncbi:MAG: NAD-dependent epimerase/dehydratase family protein [Bacteroidetes bacterium]|nr:NAD-dependent epimerase/dehydratase family protein [Bacteroidota bacterium]